MANLKIRGISLDVNLSELLRGFEWDGARWSDGKLIACSPFRNEHRPSFFVNLDGEYAGTWGDSGASDAEFEKGNLVTLLAYLRGVTYEEAEEFLLDEYAPSFHWEKEKEPLSIPIKEKGEQYPDAKQYRKYLYRSLYLEKERGISEEVQRACYIGYDRENEFITIPWFDVNGRLGNVKLRSTQSKIFKYWRGALPVSSMVYNLNLAYKHGYTEAVLCEGEIDAMTWMCHGKLGIATGGANISLNQIELIIKSPLETIHVAGDNDEAGKKFLKKVIEGLIPHKKVSIMKIPHKCKDSNEAHVKKVLNFSPLMHEEKIKILFA